VIPQEQWKILNALENRSQGDTQTRDYQTQQIDNAFAQQLGLSEILGADANDLSGLFQQKMQGIIQTGQQFHASNLESFGKYIGGLEMIGRGKDAEFASQQNIVKDQIQAAAADGQAANQTINTGINTALSAYSAYQQKQLYQDYLSSTGTGTTGSIAGGNSGFSNSTIKDAIPALAGTVQTNFSAPQRTVGVGAQTIIPNNNAGTVNLNDAGFLNWLQTNGIGTKR